MHFSKIPLIALRNILEPPNQKDGAPAKVPRASVPGAIRDHPWLIPIRQLIRPIADTRVETRTSIPCVNLNHSLLALRKVAAEFAGIEGRQNLQRMLGSRIVVAILSLPPAPASIRAWSQSPLVRERNFSRQVLDTLRLMPVQFTKRLS
ncbi:uncharacterized protein L3040_003049 [Drepanopeziza brunnea f. sp. 'multigermtubi']|uniref:uncharacterized protein n=1 Tax=Drepanopeziza brunnea f. sp. 'multigermtubi' TaxID=698441 RepID=UPI00239F688D|nr:hypothetical protein L3040_003049 [Drepanopeziza brunnea f. sp. 'multigermtubi']